MDTKGTDEFELGQRSDAPSPPFASLGEGNRENRKGEVQSLKEREERFVRECESSKIQRKRKLGMRAEKRKRMKTSILAGEGLGTAKTSKYNGPEREFGRTRAETRRRGNAAGFVAGKKPGVESQGSEMEYEIIVKGNKRGAQMQPNSYRPSRAVTGGKYDFISSIGHPMNEEQEIHAEREGWGAQSDDEMEGAKEPNIKIELIDRDDSKLATTPLIGAGKSWNEEEYASAWNGYEMGSVNINYGPHIHDKNHYHSGYPYTYKYPLIRRDSGFSLGGDSAEFYAPDTGLMLRGGELYSVGMAQSSYSSEQLPFKQEDGFKGRELYKTGKREPGDYRKKAGMMVRNAVEGGLNIDSREEEGKVEKKAVPGALKEGSYVDKKITDSKETEYPVPHFVVPSPFGNGNDIGSNWDQASDEGDWGSMSSIETVEIPEPGSGNGVRGEWPGWEERDSPVWLEQDWGKWVNGARGPYGQEGH